MENVRMEEKEGGDGTGIPAHNKGGVTEMGGPKTGS